MATEYDRSYLPLFPRLTVAMSLPDSGLRSPSLWGLVDTGADVTLVPRHQLQALNAGALYRARLRSHWGEPRPVTVYLVDLDVAGHTLPGVEVIADDLADDVLLGRNVLNRIILLLDGPAQQTEVLSKRPRRR